MCCSADTYCSYCSSAQGALARLTRMTLRNEHPGSGLRCVGPCWHTTGTQPSIAQPPRNKLGHNCGHNKTYIVTYITYHNGSGNSDNNVTYQVRIKPEPRHKADVTSRQMRCKYNAIVVEHNTTQHTKSYFKLIQTLANRFPSAPPLVLPTWTP